MGGRGSGLGDESTQLPGLVPQPLSCVRRLASHRLPRRSGNWRRICPDFVFFSGDDDDIKVSISDSLGVHLGDAIPKLQGLARFALEYGDAFHRIEAVAKMKNDFLRVLDLKKDEVQRAVLTAPTPSSSTSVTPRPITDGIAMS